MSQRENYFETPGRSIRFCRPLLSHQTLTLRGWPSVGSTDTSPLKQSASLKPDCNQTSALGKRNPMFFQFTPIWGDHGSGGRCSHRNFLLITNVGGLRRFLIRKWDMIAIHSVLHAWLCQILWGNHFLDGGSFAAELTVCCWSMWGININPQSVGEWRRFISGCKGAREATNRQKLSYHYQILKSISSVFLTEYKSVLAPLPQPPPVGLLDFACSCTSFHC